MNTTPNDRPHLVIAISGASGAIYGIRLLEVLHELPVHTHAIISKAARITLAQETQWKLTDVHALADEHHVVDNIGASIASGSFQTCGMIIAPCSIKTMSEIATGVTTSLISRAADVTLKEQRKLVLMVRETPLHYGHLATMKQLSQMGAVIAPPVPAFYNKPQNIDDIINHSVGRVLDILDIETNQLTHRWKGIKNELK